MIKKSKQNLNSINENYLEHMLVAFKVTYNMFFGSLLILIHHVLIPGLLQTSERIKIKELYEFINKKK